MNQVVKIKERLDACDTRSANLNFIIKTQVWWPKRATLKDFLPSSFCEKRKQKTFQWQKQSYFRFDNSFVLKTLSLRKCFLNKDISFQKILFLFRKHFKFCLQIKIFSFQKQK